jgi:phosphate transport system protein
MPTTPHGFSDRIDALKADLVGQGRRVQTLLESAFAAFFTRDESKAGAAVALDDEIDRVDVSMEQSAVTLLEDATREGAALTGSQLRMVLTIVKVNNELERIADAGVEVAERVSSVRDLSVPFPETCKVMSNSAVGILRDCMSSVAKGDARLAKIVLQSQHAVTEFKDRVLRDSEERIARGAMGVDLAFQLHEVASQCELIADHCTNIAEQVIYLETGAVVRHTEAKWIEIPPRRS